MYRAKRAGTDRIEIFSAQMRSEKDERIAIESDLRRAIEQGRLTVLYQPIVTLSTEGLVGFEALVRWDHPRYGQLSPSEFIPVAEETDLVVKLGSYVLARAIDEVVRWQAALPRPDQPLFVSVNVSSRQLLKADLVPEIRHLLGRAVAPSGSLRLEITESLVMENPEAATHVLELLKGAGAELALDDFGTGYSSLAYLQRFPFDTIKIDKALVQAGTENEAGAAIVRASVLLAHELGRKVVAEGIETPEDAAFLRALGCEYAQGFYYGQPMSERDALQLTRLVAKSEKKMGRRVHKLGPSKPAANGKGPEPVAAASTRANSATPAEPRTRGSRPPASPPQGSPQIPPPQAMPPQPPAQMPPPAPPNGAHSQTIPLGLRGKGAGITLPQPPPSAAPVTVPLGRNGSGMAPPPPSPPPPRPAADAGTNGRAPPASAGPGPLPLPPMPPPMPHMQQSHAAPPMPPPMPPGAMPPPASANGAGAPPPPLLPHERLAPPSPDKKGPPPPPRPSANGIAPPPINRPLPHTVRETAMPAALRASLDRLAGRQPAADPAAAPAPPDREHTDA
jgi:EAL domain-containing protein (putative c-di-GMP-specific phosphodiesterase class I)